MTERCQTKFIEKNDNPNYFIFIGVLVALLGVLYFYRFHFVTICVSYVLGCVACYYGLNSNFLHNFVEHWTCHFLRNSPDKVDQDVPVKGCITCGSKDCNRHDPEVISEPWTGLQLHKQLDQAIEDFYNTILEQFINSWYSKITLQPFFVDELRLQLRYASAALLRRANKIEYARFITERLAPCALRHYAVCSAGAPVEPHPAAANRAAELKYLRSITEAVLPYVLRNADIDNSVFRVLIREIFAGWVLLSLTDVLADPYILNALVILATGDETMAQLPTSPNYKVEFLENFVRRSDALYAERARLLRVDLELAVNEPRHLYAVMQHVKTTSIQLLQFYRDIKVFQTRILNPEPSREEREWVQREARELFARYLDRGGPQPLPPTLLGHLRELRALFDAAPDDVARLQTSPALYQAARESHAALEKNMLPKFLHSEEYYKLLIGSRIPTGYHKQMTKRPQDSLLNATLKLGGKLKSAIRPQSIDGQVLDCFTNSDENEGDSIDNMDILKYLDSVTADDSLGDQDLSHYKVVLTHVETRLATAPRRGAVRVFRLAVAVAGAGAGAGRLCAVERSEHDFHLLRAKLHEFHGDRLLADLPLPSRRDNSPLETLRYKYEDFLQRLLKKSLLQTSELLYLFLTVDGDFSMVVQASTLNATGTDLANIYQSVAHKLRKEKGQHLESFMKNYLVSTDKERYQALKHGTTREVEEALEVNEEAGAVVGGPPPREARGRDLIHPVFQNNFDMQPTPQVRDTVYQRTLVGFTQCSLYILVKIVKARSLVTGVVGGVACAVRSLTDMAANCLLDTVLRELLSERRLAHLIRLGHDLIFGKRSTPRADPLQQREKARSQLLSSIPTAATLAIGPGLPTAVLTAFELVQCPQLNKQLVYNLLDLCIMELFPELRDTELSKNS